ncbi:MAG: ATP-binding cassette domain-containing protein [Bacilli bacterium]
MSLIEVKKLTKTYRVTKNKEKIVDRIKNLLFPEYEYIKAVNSISFNIDEGEIVGYLGENGAGKSTTIKMLTGILTPTSGSAIVNGRVPYQKRMENNIEIAAIFGQKTSLWWDLPVIDSLKLIGSMYKMDIKTYKRNLEYIINELQLQELLQKQVKNLSLGQKMKCEIAAAFLHNPKIVYLDEPTIGLDILVKENIRRFIKDMNKKFNTTIILTTHDVKDVEELCRRIILVDRGKKIYDGDINEFKEIYTTESYVTLVKQSLIKNIDCNKENFDIIYEDENTLKIKYDPKEINTVEIISIIGKHYKIVDAKTETPGLEELLKKVYRGVDDVK